MLSWLGLPFSMSQRELAVFSVTAGVFKALIRAVVVGRPLTVNWVSIYRINCHSQVNQQRDNKQ